MTVTLTGAAPPAEAQIQVQVRHNGRTTTYTQVVMLREDGLAAVIPFVVSLHDASNEGQENGTTVRVCVRQAGHELAAKMLPLPTPLDPDAYTVLVLTRSGDVPSFLTRLRPAGSGRHVSAAPLPDVRPNGTSNGVTQKSSSSGSAFTTFLSDESYPAVQPLTMDTRALPTNAQGYQSVDAIVLADLPLDDLTEAQIEAIKSYVRGGLLLVSGGGDAVRLQNAFFTDLLPVVSPHTRYVPFPPALSARYHVKAGKSASLALATGALKPNAYSLFADAPDALPLVSVLDYGVGRVIFTAFDVFDPVLRDWPAAPALWRDLLGAGNRQARPHDVGQDKAPELLPHVLLADAEASGQAGTQQLADALAGEQANSVLAPLTLCSFFVVYTLLLAPFTFVLLKRRDRPEWAWLVIPVFTVGFTLIAFWLIVRVKGSRLIANRAVIVETTANSNQAAGYARVTLYAPRRAAYDIAFAALTGRVGTAMPREVWLSEGRSDAINDLAIATTPDATTIHDARIGRWQTRSFEVPIPVSIGDGIAAQCRLLSGGQAQFTVTNNTPYVLRACALLSPPGAAGIGDLAPGQTRSAIIRESGNFAAGHSGLPTTFKARTQVNIARGLAGALGLAPETDSGSGAEDTVQPDQRIYALIGWFDAPLVKVRVDGSNLSDGSEVNLLFTRLPAPPNIIPVPTRQLQDAPRPAARTQAGKNSGDQSRLP